MPTSEITISTQSNNVRNAQASANSHLSARARLLLQDFGQRLGLTLIMPDGALVLTTGSGPDWHLEITANGAFWIIHVLLCRSADATPAMLERYLRLNGQIDHMRGASICIEEGSNTVRLYLAMAAEHVEVDALESTFAHLIQLHDALASVIT
jgi:hypothetical protein